MPESMQYNVGSIKCYVLSDGYVNEPLDPAEIFPDVTAGEFKQAVEKYNIDTEQVRIDRNCLLIVSGDNKILVDPGVGPKWNGELPENLSSTGIEPSEIDHIVISHGHGDHIAGAMGEKNELVFTNAQFWMWQTEWEFWSNPNRYGDHREYPANHPTSKATSLIQDRIELISSEGEFLPGITSIQAPGHTMGHMGLKISDGDEALIYAGDAFLYPFQFEYIEWCAPYDRYPEIMIKSRHKLCELSEREDAPVMSYHFSFPGIGRAVRDGSKWMWQAEF